MYRKRRSIYLTSDQRKIDEEIITIFIEIFMKRNALLEIYRIKGDYRFMYFLSRKASLLAIGETSWLRVVASIVSSLEKSFSTHLMYIRDEQERQSFITDAYKFLNDVDKLKNQRPVVLDNLPPPFRIKLQPEPSSDSGSED